MTIPYQPNKRTPAPKPKRPDTSKGMQFYSEVLKHGSGNPSIEGMARSLSEAEHSLGLVKQQRLMSDHIRLRKAAAEKYKANKQP